MLENTITIANGYYVKRVMETRGFYYICVPVLPTTKPINHEFPTLLAAIKATRKS